jgi:hypothetical protein
LLDRLEISDRPIALDEEDEGVKGANPSMGAAAREDAGEKKSNQVEREGSEADGEEQKDVSALV